MSDSFIPPKKRPKKEVLEEDEYLSSISSIIERDYFPDKKKLLALKRLLDAEELGDPLLIQIAREELQRTEDNNSVLATPDTHVTSKFSQSKADQTLDEFLAKYSSEDNVSFEEIQEKHREKLAEKYSWIDSITQEDIRLKAIANQTQAAITSSNTKDQLKSISAWPDLPLSTLATSKEFKGKPKEIIKENTRIPPELLIELQTPSEKFPEIPAYQEIETPEIEKRSKEPDRLIFNNKRFRMQDPSEKEELMIKLAAKLNRSSRERSRRLSDQRLQTPRTFGSIFSPSPKFSRAPSTIFPVCDKDSSSFAGNPHKKSKFM
ncbi:DGCR14 [Blepharisma stoltei]|uniref:Uncharacterized protein n=1 Tax=Blepharisma stoltei TaxID=1481888 RepID=A0AAU9JZQ1_9CILI|nr:unnamed protein product [Blepharisma stoltei]